MKIVGPGHYTTDSIIFFPCDTLQEAKVLTWFLTSNLVRYIVSNTRSSMVNSKTLLTNIPTIDLTRSWTDQELYQHFNLTQDEIDLIEAVVK